MNCKLCKQETSVKVCTTCRDFLHWNYPGEKVEDVLEKYKELSDAHFYLRRRKRK
ncbi:MAG TPA: hypothetical protein VJC21_05920 [Candidatus Nanoarchaeia archaeon]|nr:hypothetical protein [Candidatus Nanoarchaeia archaeon]